MTKPTHPNFGRELRIEQHGNEVHLIFVAGSRQQSNSLVDELVRQLKAGTLNLAIMGKPTSIEDTTYER